MDEIEDNDTPEDPRRSAFDPSEIEEESTWDSDESLASLKMERSVTADETDSDMAKRLIKENAPAAALSIIHIALHESNGRTRLAASQYLLDRTLGKPGLDPDFANGTDPITTALEKINALALSQGNPPVPEE